MFWVTVAMVGARTLAMALNRLIDAELDAANPRTAARELPSGLLTRAQVLALSAAAFAVFLVAVFQLDPIVRWLWPIPVAMFFVYPYLKRFTWLCHLWLGACLGLAPVGAWLAVAGTAPWEAWALGGAVLLWVAGFDLFYSLYDLEHDRDRGAALVGGALRRTRRLLRRARLPCGHGRPARTRGRRPRCRRRRTGPESPPSPDCSRTSTHRAAGRSSPAGRGVLHGERRDQHRLLRLRLARTCSSDDPRARAREALRPAPRSPGVDFDLPRDGFLARDRAERVREDDASPRSRRSRRSYPRNARGGRRPWANRLPRPRAAGVPGAHGAREPRSVRQALPRAGATGADRDAARALRSLGGAVRAGRRVLARHEPASRALPRAAPRSRAARPRRAVRVPGRAGRRPARPRARGARPGPARSSCRRTIPRESSDWRPRRLALA